MAVGSWPKVTAAFGMDHGSLLSSHSALPPAQATLCSAPLSSYFISSYSQTRYSGLKRTTRLVGFQPPEISHNRACDLMAEWWLSCELRQRQGLRRQETILLTARPPSYLLFPLISHTKLDKSHGRKDGFALTPLQDARPSIRHGRRIIV